FRKKCKVYLTLHRNGIPLDNLRKYNKIFAISEDVKSNIRGSYNIISCPNGVLYDNIDIKVDYNFDTFKIIQIGRLQSKIKGQDILINAIHHLVYHLKFDNISLDIVGQGPDMKLLQKLIDDLSLNNYVKLVGNWDRDYLYQNLKNYSLLVQPSRDEGFGLTIAEGMFAKIPVLVSDIGGPMEVIGQGNFGFHFENTNFVDCANKIFNIKNTYLDLENTQKLSDAYNFALEKFSIQKT
ncbi:MAG: glycosyltransferase, partial [Bacteroidetes bacterium B1(2017)]